MFCFCVFFLVCSSQEMCGAGGREVHRQAGGCGIDVITHLAEGKRWSVTLNNQMALHHRARFPPLRLFMQPLGGCRRKTRKHQCVLSVGRSSCLSLGTSSRGYVRKPSSKIGSIHYYGSETSASERLFFFFLLLAVKQWKQSAEHCCIDANVTVNCSVSV